MATRWTMILLLLLCHCAHQAETTKPRVEIPIHNWKLAQQHYQGVEVEKAGQLADFAYTEVNKQGYLEFQHLPTGLIFVLLPGGELLLGSPENIGEKDEQPQHKAALSPFLIAKYEITQAIWHQVMGHNPSFYKGDKFPLDKAPLESVSWLDAQEFCQKTGLELPSEAQWEYACRAGTSGEHHWNDTEARKDYAWYDFGGEQFSEQNNQDATPDSKKQTKKSDLVWMPIGVGQKKPNGFGLHDMAGNVAEWCADWYSDTYYMMAEAQNPRGPDIGIYRVIRGGAWYNQLDDCRCASRRKALPRTRDYGVGMRPVYNLK